MLTDRHIDIHIDERRGVTDVTILQRLASPINNPRKKKKISEQLCEPLSTTNHQETKGRNRSISQLGLSPGTSFPPPSLFILIGRSTSPRVALALATRGSLLHEAGIRRACSLIPSDEPSHPSLLPPHKIRGTHSLSKTKTVTTSNDSSS